jgi:hypothetical protein
VSIDAFRPDDCSLPGQSSVREQLARWCRTSPGQPESSGPAVRQRPLGVVSDFAVMHMSARIDAVDAGQISPEDFFNEVERLLQSLSPRLIDSLVAQPGSMSSRVAALDLMMIERSLSVVYGGPTQHYRARRSQSLLLRTLRRLARAQKRPLYLGWIDIANWHPVQDPRTFVSEGFARDQEILLYRVQHGIERTFQRIVVEWPVDYMSSKIAEEMGADLDVAVSAMLHLRTVRQHGEFDRLNRFLTPNGEAHGHATGSFSAWTMLAGFVLTGHLPKRLVLEENRAAYDPDARPFIDAVISGEITPLPRMRGADHDGADIERLVAHCIRQFGRFLEVHRGAVRSQAPAALAEQAPSDPEVTNLQSFNEIIASTKGVEWIADQQHGSDGPEPLDVADGVDDEQGGSVA